MSRLIQEYNERQQRLDRLIGLNEASPLFMRYCTGFLTNGRQTSRRSALLLKGQNSCQIAHSDVRLFAEGGLSFGDEDVMWSCVCEALLSAGYHVVSLLFYFMDGKSLI